MQPYKRMKKNLCYYEMIFMIKNVCMDVHECIYFLRFYKSEKWQSKTLKK